MAALVGPLDSDSGQKYAWFAAHSGARFNDGGGDILDGLNDTVDETTVEAVVDDEDRPLVLWLRTPEPVDWRRVALTLRIRHVKQSGDCPEGYAHRDRLNLTVTALPSPDATAAFLIGSLDGHPTRLPRGEYELELLFDPAAAGLPKLRPGVSIGPTPERVEMKFIQPLGQPWPLSFESIVLPAGLINKLVELYDIDWSLIDRLIDPHFGPNLPDVISAVGPRPPVPENGSTPPGKNSEAETASLTSQTQKLARSQNSNRFAPQAGLLEPESVGPDDDNVSPNVKANLEEGEP